MNLNEKQKKFLEKNNIEIKDNYSNDEIIEIEEKVGNIYTFEGVDDNGNVTEEGLICESILDCIDDI